MLLFLLYIMAALDWLMVFVRKKKQQQNDLLKVFHVFSLWPLRNAHTHTIELKKITKKWIQPTLRKWPNHTGIRGRSVNMLIACSNIHMSIWMAAGPSSHQVRQTFNITLVVALYDVVVIVTAVVFHTFKSSSNDRWSFCCFTASAPLNEACSSFTHSLEENLLIWVGRL